MKLQHCKKLLFSVSCRLLFSLSPVSQMDLYHANALLPLEEEAILQTALTALNKVRPRLICP